ncbi:MAG TPA: hypothetical protein ENH24_02190 [Nitrospirae bacterium]|nr:hypothetical protein [Nitrospirota bacterium]
MPIGDFGDYLVSPPVVPDNPDVKDKLPQGISSFLSGNNEIIYAGLYGTNKTHGIEYFGNSLPSAIISNLKRLYWGG